MEGALSNPTRWAGPGEARRGSGRRQVFDSIPSTVTAPLAKRKETKSTHATSRAVPGAAGLPGPEAGAGARRAPCPSHPGR